ncbi:hypothetical protein QN277_013506 [Acacia crassicarpa]|uniref:ENT domain-containing protein n=1 Tax=Acacia crassicarpa TaxID=499986 RepID=A0AAE1N3D2_9FABA|nr:hypothetical protein QN277_013506 [Acacia crassicarpa]
MDLTRLKHNAVERHEERNVKDLKHHVHGLEIVAYSSVLKAFIVQSDLLSWGKEGIISNLRKELNVTDTEHAAILAAINSDESIKRIREQRTLSTHAEICVKVNSPGYASGSAQNFSITTNTSSPVAYLPSKNMSRCQSSLAAFPIHSSMPLKFKDDQMTAEVATFSHGSAEQSARMIKQKFLGSAKTTHQLEKGFGKSDFSNIKNRSKVIELQAPNRVIHNAEKMLFGVENLDPVVDDKAKSTIWEQESAVLEALAKLADVLKRKCSITVSRRIPPG